MGRKSLMTESFLDWQAGQSDARIRANLASATTQWADFFRTRIRLWTTPFQFTAAVHQGEYLAKNQDARVPPGFIGGKKR